MQTVMLKEQALFCTDYFITLIRIHIHPHHRRVMTLYLPTDIVDNQFLSDVTVNYVKLSGL
jgi:hypothetical protein